MTTIVDFLMARIAEDEAVAQAAQPSPWRPDSEGCCVIHGGRDADEDFETHDLSSAEHIARWDPARVLAECAAKRAIVKQFTDTTEDEAFAAAQPEAGDWFAAQQQALDLVLLALAQPYSGHPDFDPSWGTA